MHSAIHAVECCAQTRDMVRDAARVDTGGGGASGSFGAVRTVYRHGTAEQAKCGRRVAWRDWMLLHGRLIARLCVCLCLFVFSLLSLLSLLLLLLLLLLFMGQGRSFRSAWSGSGSVHVCST